jgi:hypothetical protein
MRLSESNVQSLQNIINNAQDLLNQNTAETISQDEIEGTLYALSVDVADLCAEHNVEMSSGGF